MVKVFHGEEELKLHDPSPQNTILVYCKTFDKPITVVFTEESWATITFWDCVFESSLIIKKEKFEELERKMVSVSNCRASDIVLQSPVRLDVGGKTTFKSITQSFSHE
jgi:hypothetical protein